MKARFGVAAPSVIVGTSVLDFLGIGAQKAATTWLFEQLASHPEISFPAGKEVHYWDQTPDPDGSAWQSLFNTASPLKQGEITPAYAILQDDQVSMIRDLNPALRVFISIRNPIERSWAAARMRHQKGQFALDDFPAIFEFLESPHCVQRNGYVKTIERWWDIFGQDQFHTLLYDDIVADPRAVLVRLAKHIGINLNHFRERSAPEISTKVFAGVEASMPDAIRDHLTARYERPIGILGRLLDLDLSSWTTGA